MQTTTVYSYDRDTGEYRGESIAHENPRRPGVYLLPAFSTEAAPPATGEHEAAVYREGAWSIVPDWRGHVYWLADGSRHEITELGVEPPAGALSEPPPPSVDDIASAKLREIKAACDAEVAALAAKYPDTEILSWYRQEREARELQADPNAATPLIDNIAAQRGITREDLAGRIIAKAHAYALDAGAAFGRRQALEDQLEAIKARLEDGEIDEDQARAEVAALAYPAA